MSLSRRPSLAVPLLVAGLGWGSPCSATTGPAAATCTAGSRPSRQGSVATGSSYAAASTAGTARLATGAAADILLSGVDFDDAGGALLFNHNGGVSSDGTRLLLCDRNNNRVLVWSTLPDGNVPPDLVLGQKDFRGNAPGSGRDGMSWPIAVHTDGTRVLVADTYNDRILIWTSFPTRSGQAADLVLQSAPAGSANGTKSSWPWPWGVWSDGTRLVVTATGGGAVLVWSSFPTRDDQPANLRLTGGGRLGTPRGVVSDGRSLVVGDHNGRLQGGSSPGTSLGNWVWKRFPASDDAVPDLFLTDPCDPQAGQMNGEMTPDGKLLLLGRGLYVWNAVPETAATAPDLVVDWPFFGGDGSDVALAGSRVYVSTANANRVVVYGSLPAAGDQPPAAAIGAPDLVTNTLDSAFIISNPVPASNGRSLFVSSDFDRRLNVWKALPGESGAHPDWVIHLPDSPWDNALWGDTLVLSGSGTTFVWRTLPTDGHAPELTWKGQVGTQTFRRFSGVALDGRYLYLSDPDSGRVHVFAGLPGPADPPAFSLELEGVARLDSDGTWLVATRTLAQGQQVVVFRVAELGPGAQGTPLSFASGLRFNLPQYATVAAGRLLVGDTGHNRVLSWSRVEDALAGRDPDLILGATDTAPRPARIGRDTLFWPAAPFFDGRFLWVGEFKFSERLLRFGGGAPVPSPDADSFIPGAASGPGASGARWRTTLTLLNPDPSAARAVKLAFLPAERDNRDAPEVAVEVPAGRALLLPDVIGETLGAAGGGGLRLRANGRVVASSRTEDVSPGAGAVTGVSLDALPASAAAAAGLVFPLTNRPGPSGVRSNAAFLNPSEEPADVEVTLADPVAGVTLGTTRLTLPPLGFGQLSDVFALLAEGRPSEAASLLFTASRPVFGYGVVLENLTNQGRHVPAVAP